MTIANSPARIRAILENSKKSDARRFLSSVDQGDIDGARSNHSGLAAFLDANGGGGSKTHRLRAANALVIASIVTRASVASAVKDLHDKLTAFGGATAPW